ncbi:MAG: T9SS type A sorting domain-containing protein [Microscillaceae bacterium]|nr:T9SS type A sorting domain-containing protein [Microscillaceae bacterium]MDW8461051.1 T9SS type A sorting domain-containing protein [Cytophagales bacterium]
MEKRYAVIFQRAVFYLVVACLFFSANFLYAQNAIVGTGFSTGWGGGSCPTGNGNFTYFSELSHTGGTYISPLLAPSGTGNRFWRFGIDWSGTTHQRTNVIGSDVDVTPGTKYTLNSNCTTSGALRYNVLSTGYRYIFKTLNAGTNPTGTWVFFEIQATSIQTITSHTPPTPTVPNTVQTLSITTSGIFPTGQTAYIRYHTGGGWGSATVAPLVYSGSGNNYHINIPAAVNTPGTTVHYYFFTSGGSTSSPLTIATGDVDLYAINLFNNSGSNYSYTVPSSYITANNGDWHTGSTWVGGSVPPTNQPVTIAHNVTISSADVTVSAMTINSSRTLTINSNRTLTTNGTITNNGTLQVNGSLRFNTGGGMSGTRPTYANGSTLIYGGTNTIGFEWLDNTPTGTGIPHHVTIAAGANVSYPPSGTYRQMNGNMLIEGTLTMPSSTIGSDIRLLGNWHRTATGVFNCDARAIFFNGTAGTQTISSDASGGEVFDVLVIQNTVQMQCNVTIRNSWGTRRLWLDSGILTRSGSQTLTIQNDVLVERRIGTLDFAPTINGTDRIRILYNGNTPVTTGNEIPPNTVNNLGRITVQNTAGVTLAANLVGSNQTTLVVGQDSGTSPLGNSLATSPYTSSGGTGVLIMNDREYSGTGANFTFNGGIVRLTHADGISGILKNTGTNTFTIGTFEFNRGASQNFGTITNLNNMTILTRNAGTHVTVNSSPTIRALDIGTGTTFTASDASDRILTIEIPSSMTSLINNGTWSSGTNTNSWLRMAGGSGHVHTISGTFNFLNIETNGNTGINFGANSTILNNGTFRINNGGFVFVNSPTYNVGSTLLYWTSSSYNRSDEWGTSKLPHHVRLGNNTNLQLNNASRSMDGNLTIDIGSTLTFNGTETLSLKGNLVVNGGVVPHQGTFNFNGSSSTQTISGTTTNVIFYNLSVASGATVQLLRNINFVDYSTNCGTMTVASGGTFDAQDFQMFGTNNCSGTVNFNINGMLRTTRQAGLFGASNTTIDNVKTSLSLDINSTIEYYRNGDQTVTARNDYGNVMISTAGDKSLAGSSTIRNTLTLNAGTLSIGNNTLTFHTGNTPIARNGTTQTGQIIMATNSSLAFGTASHTSGNAFTLPNNVFSGMSPIAFQNLTIIRTNDLSMGNQDFAISGTVSVGGSITGGDLNLNGRFIDLGNTGTISEDLPNNALITDKTPGLNDSNKGGYLKFDNRIVNASLTNIGGSALLLNRIGGSDFTINFYRYHYKAGGAFPFGSIQKVYQISIATGSFSDLRMRINYATQELAGLPDDSSLKLFRWSNTVAPLGWTNQGGTRTAGSPSYVDKASGITTFSHWTIGSENTPLHAFISHFDAQQTDKQQAKLSWKGNFETAIGFVVEKSSDNLNFSSVTQLDHQPSKTNYHTFDNNFVQSSYYRLKVLLPQNDYFYSDVKYLEKKQAESDLLIYPNPFTERLYIQVPSKESPMQVSLLNISGVQLVNINNKAEQTENDLNTILQTLPQGTYIAKISYEGQYWVKKLIKIK